MRSNIKDVAELAGVSIATVSRVVNDIDKVKAGTRERVLAAAHKLKYTPNAAARGLITKRTESIGLLLPDLYGEFFSEVIRGADEAAQRKKYHLIVSSSHNELNEIEGALRVMRGRVDGLIVMSPQVNSEILLRNLPKYLPVVLLNCAVDSPRFDSILPNGFTGTKEMIRYLLGLGHRRIAIIKGNDQNVDARERLRGYRAAMREFGAPLNVELEFSGDFTEASGFDAVQKLLKGRRRPTAIFASNDSMAIGAMSALHEAGVKIPKEMSICGFDDIPIARHLRPALTTVHIPICDLGTMAIERLLSHIGNGRKVQPTRTIVPTSLSIRLSCQATRTNPIQHKEK